MARGALNSNEPLLLVASMSGRFQINWFLLDSWEYVPSHSPTTGLQPILCKKDTLKRANLKPKSSTYGKGIVILTSINSKFVWASSYSILTSQLPSPASDGQQLIRRGTNCSSLLCNLHFSTPTSVSSGNGFEGCFKPICKTSAIKFDIPHQVKLLTCERILNSSLSTFGCVCNWIPWLFWFSSCTLIFVHCSLRICNVVKPCSSNCWTPPSRLKRTISFSCSLKWTLKENAFNHPNGGAGVARLTRSRPI